MGVLKIFANGIELDYVNETLTLKKENNAFIQDFKVAHSSFPFLIIENANTRQALGTRDITSVLKAKVVPVVVLDMGERFTGELTILAYVSGHRKCDVKYGSEVLTILDKPLSEILPVLSIIPGETNPVEFQEEFPLVVDGYNRWPDFVNGYRGKIFPEVDFAFPKMLWENKYGETLEQGDEWYSYGKYVNNYGGLYASFIGNIYSEVPNEINVYNSNVAAPQLFLLGMFRLAFASIGYTIAGNFVESDFARRLLLWSVKDNLCAVPLAPAPYTILYSNMASVPMDSPGFVKRRYLFIPDAEGDYTFDYSINEGLRPPSQRQLPTSRLSWGEGADSNNSDTDVYQNYNDPNRLYFQGTFTINVAAGQVGATFNITYLLWPNAEGSAPVSFQIVKKRDPKIFQMMHPTIKIGRYAPDWNLATALNEAKKLFNLNIIFNDRARIVNFDYAQDLLVSGQIMDAGKSLAISEYTPPAFTGLVLKYANDQDGNLYIDRTGVRSYFGEYKDNENIETIESKFKLIDRFQGVVSLETTSQKEGTGLMIFNPGDGTAPGLIEQFEGLSLDLSGVTGIYENYFRTFLQFRLYGSQLQMEGPFTEHQLQRMDKLQKIAIDNQAYVILSTEFKPTPQGNYFVTLELQTITF